MADLISMKNIGQEMENKLRTVGICSSEELIQIGSKEAFVRLRMHFSNVCLVHLYTLQGAIDHIEFQKLSEDVKLDLKRFSDGLK